MSDQMHCGAEARQFPRLSLPAMYTLIRVRTKGETRFNQTGYIYDISQTGLRFELDDGILPGTEIEFRALLPGSQTTTFSASGRTVRMHDDIDEPGPVRMGLVFDQFKTVIDREKLHGYLDRRSTRLAMAA